MKSIFSQHVILDSSEKRPNPSTVANDFICAQLTLSKDPIYESDWDFTNAVTQSLRADHHLHLKYIPTGLRQGDYPLQYVLLVQPANAKILTKATPRV